jgi:uncharacterized protein YuzE
MKLRIDRETDALYLRLHDTKVVESEQIAPGVIVDFDSRNRAVGIEILNVSRRAPKEATQKSSSLSESVVVREKNKHYGN